MSAWPFIAAAAGLHVVYQLLLWASYQQGECSQAHPWRGGRRRGWAQCSSSRRGATSPGRQLVGILVISPDLISLALDGGRVSRSVLPALGVPPGRAASDRAVADARPRAQQTAGERLVADDRGGSGSLTRTGSVEAVVEGDHRLVDAGQPGAAQDAVEFAPIHVGAHS